MGESRQELLAWLNNLLQLNLTKVEQCGTGYVQLAFTLLIILLPYPGDELDFLAKYGTKMAWNMA